MLMNTRGKVFKEKLEKIKDKIYTFLYIFKLKKECPRLTPPPENPRSRTVTDIHIPDLIEC